MHARRNTLYDVLPNVRNAVHVRVVSDGLVTIGAHDRFGGNCFQFFVPDGEYRWKRQETSFKRPVVYVLNCTPCSR